MGEVKKEKEQAERSSQNLVNVIGAESQHQEAVKFVATFPAKVKEAELLLKQCQTSYNKERASVVTKSKENYTEAKKNADEARKIATEARTKATQAKSSSYQATKQAERAEKVLKSDKLGDKYPKKYIEKLKADIEKAKLEKAKAETTNAHADEQESLAAVLQAEALTFRKFLLKIQNMKAYRY